MYHHPDIGMKVPENPGFKFYLGLSIFVASFFMLPIGLILKGFATTHFMKGLVLGLFWISAPIMKITSIAVLGKPSYLWINYQIRCFFHRVAMPHKVSLARYNFGLVLFVLPFLPNYLISFMPHLLPDSQLLRYFIVILADAIFLASLFVLGGDFWDKLRALFIFTAKARFEDENGQTLAN
ncbi:MAG: hypothetical protein WCK84_11440 [Bacteroidota bacterium]